MRITGPDGRVHESVSDQESIILGSGAGAAVRIPDPQVSNLHLMLKRERNGVVMVIDLGSEAGTHLAGQPVREPRSLASGDVISVGRSRVEVLFGGGDPPTSFADLRLDRGASAVPALHLNAPPRHTRPPEAPAARARGAPARIPSEPPTPAHHVLQVALLWGDRVLDVKHFTDGAPVRIGDSPRNHFQVFSTSVGASMRVAVAGGGKVALTVPPQAKVTVARAGGSPRPATGVAAVTLALDELARVEIENVALLVRQVRPPPGVVVQRDRADYTFFKIASISLLMGVALVVSLLITPREAQSSSDLFRDSAQQVAHYLVHPAVVPKPVKPKQKSTLAEGEKASEEEGKMGKPEAKQEEADPSRPGSPIVDPTKREADRTTIHHVGLLGAVARLGGKDGSSNVLGPGGFGTGINDAVGGLKTGAGMGDAHGFGGLGERGKGPGAGGTGLGLGGLGTKGKGRGPPGGTGDLGGLQKEVVKVVPGKTIVVGGLSKEVIYKVVKSHEREIQYCYEQELNAHPDLSGKVAVVWTIGPDGGVTDATVTETSLSAERAEQCILTRIRRWKFPEVPGGGIVTVTFPWVFKPAGSDEKGEG
ncbi:MAG TPA: AgmX/PglI C-terminal domain-containing protein [Myxococcaceae bacterium]